MQKISIHQKSKRYTISLMLKLKNMENYADFDRPGLIKMKFEMKVLMSTSLFLSGDVTNKILSHISNYVVDGVMLPEVDNSSISVRELIIITLML